MDARKQKRMLSNRESARRSRMKKQQQLQDLTNEVARLTKENSQVAAQVNELVQHHLRLEADNDDHRAEAAKLAERLRSLSSAIRCMKELRGVAMHVPALPDSIFEPWQPPRPSLSIEAADSLQR